MSSKVDVFNSQNFFTQMIDSQEIYSDSDDSFEYGK